MEIPRRLACTGRAVAGIYPLTLTDLARAIAEPALLGRGLQAWDAGHAALVAARLLEAPHRLKLAPDVPLDRVAIALARTLSELRRAEVDPARLDIAAGAGATPEDRERLRALAGLYRGFHERIEGHFADHATLFRAAREHLAEARWLEGAEILVADDLELDAVERRLLAALAARFPVRRIGRVRPPAIRASGFAGWAAVNGIREIDWKETELAAIAPSPSPAALARVQSRLFEPPSGPADRDDSVDLLTAPGEAAEVRGVVRAPAPGSGARRALRGHGRDPAPAPGVRAAVHRPARAPGHPLPPASLAAPALRPHRALAAAAPALPRAAAGAR